MGGWVTFSGFETHSVAKYTKKTEKKRFSHFLKISYVFLLKVEDFVRGGTWIEKFKTSFQGPGPLPTGTRHPLT